MSRTLNCIKCGNELGQIVVHTTMGPHHLFCPHELKPTINDFQSLKIPKLFVADGEAPMVVLLKVKRAMDLLVIKHNALVALFENYLNNELGLLAEVRKPNFILKPDPQAEPVRKPTEKPSVIRPKRTEFCKKCPHMAHEGLCGEPTDEGYCDCQT